MAYIVGYCCAIERAVSSEDVSPKHDIVLLGVGVRLSAGGRGLRLVVGPADRAARRVRYIVVVRSVRLGTVLPVAG